MEKPHRSEKNIVTQSWLSAAVKFETLDRRWPLLEGEGPAAGPLIKLLRLLIVRDEAECVGLKSTALGARDSTPCWLLLRSRLGLEELTSW